MAIEHDEKLLRELRKIGLYRDSLICFDCETTGLKPYFDEILTFSAVDGHGNVLIDAMFRPEGLDSWPEAEKINGVSPEMVADCPTFKSRREEIQELFDTHYVLLGYNIKFDMGFLDAQDIVFRCMPHPDGYPFDRYERELMFDFSDYYGERNDGYAKAKWQKLTTAAEHVGYQWTGRAHGSLADAKAALAVAEWLYCGEK